MHQWRHVWCDLDLMPAAAVPATFSRAEFSAAVNEKKRRDKDWRPNVFLLAWLCGAGVIVARLSSHLSQTTGWTSWAWNAGILLFFIGPPTAACLYWQRRNPIVSQCPNCGGSTLSEPNAICILASGRCGCCGYEMLPPEDGNRLALVLQPPSVEFKTISVADVVSKSLTARWKDAWRITTFALFYVAGLAPFLWIVFRETPDILPVTFRQFVALFVLWLFLSPVLWLRLSSSIWGAIPFPKCPHCNAAWLSQWDSMIVTSTGRCGHCGVQVLEESRDSSTICQSTPIKNSAEGIGKHGPTIPSELISRSQFLRSSLAEKEARETALPKNRKWIAIWLGSTLAVTTGSILFLRGRYAVAVPLIWYMVGCFLLDRLFVKIRKRAEESAKGPDGPFKKCPFCNSDTSGFSQGIIITTGRCKGCLNVILHDDLGCCDQKVAH